MASTVDVSASAALGEAGGKGEEVEDVMGGGTLVREAEDMKKIVEEVVQEWLLKEKEDQSEIKASSRAVRAKIDTFKGMIEKYKEQSTLLDPYLKDLVLPLSGALKKLAHEHLYEEGANEEQKASLLVKVVSLCRLLHMITTVRGYKTVKKFYPSAPEDVEPAFYLLKALKEGGEDKTGLYDETTMNSFWEAHCTLLVWLSLLVLIPFDLATIDSASTGTENETEHTSIVHKIVGSCKEFLLNAGLVRDMAAYLLSQLLTRPDNAQVLEEFLKWSQENLTNKASSVDAAHVFLTLGIASTIAAIFKHGSRMSLLAIAPLAWQVMETLESLPESKNNSLIRKLRCKLLCRVGLVNLKPRLALWRYSLGSRTIDHHALKSKLAESKANDEEYDEDEDDIDCIEDIEDLVGSLLENLCDKDTIVRWSAAKGIGRISNRLPKDMIADIIDSILELFSITEGDGSWHGGCLALAELAWRGLLLPQQLAEVIPKVVEALQYDVKRGAHSVGSHVRDAGCYVFWSFSRSYSSEIMAEYLPVIAQNLLVLSCFDREINCRRAASAAFQELVGRQGNIAHGIEALTIADYFTVSSRKAAYLTVAPQIAAFEEYSSSLAQHLLGTKVFHWEKSLRELAAEALASLLPMLGKDFGHKALSVLLVKTEDQALDCRHGALVGLAKLLPVMTRNSWSLAEDEVEKIVSLIDRVENVKFYRGKGGTIIHEAVCCLLDGICKAKIPLESAIVGKIDKSICYSLRHLSTVVQQYAVTAFKSLCASYYSNLSPETQIELTVSKLINHINSERNSMLCQGYLLALGSCPANILWSSAEKAFECMRRMALVSTEGVTSEVEARVASIEGITTMCRTLSLSVASKEQFQFFRDFLYESILPCLLESIDDYTIDNRGDIGSWVRRESMEAMEVSLLGLSKIGKEDIKLLSSSPLEGKQTVETTAVAALIKQSLEKIDRIRHAAFLHTQKVLGLDTLKGRIERWTELREIYQAGQSEKGKEDLFNHLPDILQLDPYRDLAIEGLALSAGGLGDSVSQTAVAALVKAVKEGGKGMLMSVSWALHSILSKNAGTSRIVVPTMRTIDFLFSKANLLSAGDAKLFELLLNEAWTSTRNCRDVVQLQVALSLIANLSYASDPIFTASLYKLIACLINRYPKIRRCAAEHLYMRIISFEEEEEDKFDVDRATELVSEVSWDTGAAAEIKAARLDLFACFGMDPPKKIESSKVKVAKKDNPLSSYQSLVNASGY